MDRADVLSGAEEFLVPRVKLSFLLPAGALSQEKASAIWRTIQSAVGWVVRVSDISRRRWCLRMTRTYNNPKPTVGMIRKSMAAMPAAWL
jgi:hypothetical protein